MKENKIEITIAGLTKVGKSMMMHLLYLFLLKNGFETEIDFEMDGLSDYDGIIDFEMKMNQNGEERIFAVRDKSKIILK